MIIEVNMRATVEVAGDVQGAEQLVRDHLAEIFPAEFYDFTRSPAVHCMMRRLTTEAWAKAEYRSTPTTDGRPGETRR